MVVLFAKEILLYILPAHAFHVIIMEIKVLRRGDMAVKKKIILVAAPPASGKTYVCERLAEAMGHAVYLDKDDLYDLLRAAFRASGNEINMDGEFYINNLRTSEYSTLLNIAFSVLRFEDTVIVGAPFGKEVRDTEYMRALKEKVGACNAELILVWVYASKDQCFERMKKRNSDRDTGKLQNFEEYAKNINYSPPYELSECGAVHRLVIFDTTSEDGFERSLKSTLEILKDGN